MSHKKNLSKAAFAALLLASNMPIDGQIEATGVQETYLASFSCASCGGKGARRLVADNATSSDSYNARTNSYQTSSSTYGNANRNAQADSSWSTAGNASDSSWNTDRNANSSWSTTGNTSRNNNASRSNDASSWSTAGNAADRNVNAANSSWNADRNANSSWSTAGNAADRNGNAANSSWNTDRNANSSWSTTGNAADRGWSTTGNAADRSWSSQGNASRDANTWRSGNAGSWSTTNDDASTWRAGNTSTTRNPNNASSWQTSGNTSSWQTTGTSPDNMMRNAPADRSWQTSSSSSAWRSGNAAGPRRNEWNRRGDTYRAAAYDIDVDVYPNQDRRYAQQPAPMGYYEYSRATAVDGNMVITEEELFAQLTPQGRADYQTLSPQGKAMALHLASQPSYTNKDMAVKDAKARTAGR